MTTNNKPGALFWIIGVVGLLWNAWGAYEYIMQAYNNEAHLAQYTAEQVAFIESAPAWTTAAFAIAVFAGVLGCLAMLIKKKWAVILLLLSLLAVLVRMVWFFFMSNGVEVWGTGMGIGMSAVVILIAIILYLYAKKAAAKGILS